MCSPDIVYCIAPRNRSHDNTHPTKIARFRDAAHRREWQRSRIRSAETRPVVKKKP